MFLCSADASRTGVTGKSEIKDRREIIGHSNGDDPTLVAKQDVFCMGQYFFFYVMPIFAILA